jgi:ferredoxin
MASSTFANEAVAPLGVMPVKVKVDVDRCQGHGRCYAVAPEVYAMDDVGYGKEIGDGTVPAGLEAKAQLGADNCPEQAITITIEDGT